MKNYFSATIESEIKYQSKTLFIRADVEGTPEEWRFKEVESRESDDDPWIVADEDVQDEAKEQLDGEAGEALAEAIGEACEWEREEARMRRDYMREIEAGIKQYRR
jgi:hypothetical protein